MTGPRITTLDFQNAYKLATLDVDRLERELDITNADHIALWLAANPGLNINTLAVRIADAYDRTMWIPFDKTTINTGDWIRLRSGRKCGPMKEMKIFYSGWISPSYEHWPRNGQRGFSNTKNSNDITHVWKHTTTPATTPVS